MTNDPRKINNGGVYERLNPEHSLSARRLAILHEPVKDEARAERPTDEINILSADSELADGGMWSELHVRPHRMKTVLTYMDRLESELAAMREEKENIWACAMSESVGLTWSYSGKFFTNSRAEAAELALAETKNLLIQAGRNSGCPLLCPYRPNPQASIGREPAK